MRTQENSLHALNVITSLHNSQQVKKKPANIEPACALHADRRPAITCLPAGRSGRSARLSSRRSFDHLGVPTRAPQLRAPPAPPDALAAQQPREWSYEPLFDLPVPRSEAGQTGDLPISDPACLPAGRCSHSRGQRAGLPHLAPPSLKTRQISLNPPARPVVAFLLASALREVQSPPGPFLRSPAPGGSPCRARPVSNFLSGSGFLSGNFQLPIRSIRYFLSG